MCNAEVTALFARVLEASPALAIQALNAHLLATKYEVKLCECDIQSKYEKARRESFKPIADILHIGFEV